MKLHHIAITVSNLQESIDFYQKFFNFEIIKEFERLDMNAKAVFLKLGDFAVELWEFQDGKSNQDDLGDIKIKGIRHIALAVENLDDEIKKLNKKGLKVSPAKKGASGGRYTFVFDLDGVAIELYEE